MRQPDRTDRVVQCAVAALLLLPLLAAFLGGGGFSDAYGAYQPTDGAVVAARRAALAAATCRSLLIGAGAALVAAAIGIPAAWALAVCHGPAAVRRSVPLPSDGARTGNGPGPWHPFGAAWRSTALLVLAALPLALPPSVAVSGWIGLLAPTGAVSAFNPAIPVYAPESRGWLFSGFGVAFVLGMNLWPVVAFQAWPALKRARMNAAYDAARMYGSSNRTFWRVVLPQAKGELAAGALLAFLLASSDFTVSSLLLVRTLPTEIHDALMVGRTAAAAWAALPLLVMVFVVAALLHWRFSPSPPSPPGPLSGRGGEGAARAPVAKAFLACGVIVGFAVPMLVCGYQAFCGGRPMSRVFGAGSEALGVSLRLAGAASLLAVFVAVLRAVLWPEVRARAVTIAALFLLAVPGSFLAGAFLAMQIGLTKWLDLGPDSALPAAVLACSYVARFIYVPLRLVEEGLAALDPEMLDAAALSGHARLSRGVSIALPLVAAHVAAAAALVFVLVLGEVALADKLAPPGKIPATVWLFQQQHLGYDEAVFGLSLLLGATVAAVLAAAGVVVAVLGGKRQ
jgi:iron(III) transport system permease protein